MGIIGWIAIGAVAGIIAKALYPGAENIGIVLTILLGIAGALLGGFVAWIVGAGDPIDEFFDISTWLGATAGSVLLLAIYRALFGARRTTRTI